jgi:S1-C subfamily serine protease
MDIEHLNKWQVVMLTLLVSFVTSIATGIVTVSLMDQAPPIVASTVNRVIEKTVETVTAAPAGQPAAAATTVITNEKTVIVSESEQIAKAVDGVSPSIVRLYSSSEEPTFLGLGVVIDAGGTIATDASAIEDRVEATLALADSNRVRAFVTRRDADHGIVYLHTSTTTEAAAQKPITWKPVSIASNKPVLGAATVALSGKTVPRIASGLVTALLQNDGGTVIDTNIADSSIMYGSPLVDTSGNLIGVSTGVSRSSSPQGFIAAVDLLPKKLAQ